MSHRLPEPDKPWLMRTYAGHSTARASNELYRGNLAKGQTGRIGISAKHTLALVNRGDGTTAELMAVAHEIAGGVQERFGIALHPEPVLVGHAW